MMKMKASLLSFKQHDDPKLASPLVSSWSCLLLYLYHKWAVLNYCGFPLSFPSFFWRIVYLKITMFTVQLYKYRSSIKIHQTLDWVAPIFLSLVFHITLPKKTTFPSCFSLFSYGMTWTLASLSGFFVNL